MELSKSVKDSFGVAGSSAKRVARSESHRVNLVAHDEASKGLGELKTGRMYQAQFDIIRGRGTRLIMGRFSRSASRGRKLLTNRIACCRGTWFQELSSPE